MPVMSHSQTLSSSELPRGNLIIPGTGAGAVVRVCPRTSFSLPSNANGIVATWVLAKYIDTSYWVSAILVVKVHLSNLAGGQLLDFLVYNASYSEEDPAQDFVGTSSLIPTTRLSTSTSPQLIVGAFSSAAAEQVRVVVQGTQTAGGAAMSATISVDLIGRPA